MKKKCLHCEKEVEKKYTESVKFFTEKRKYCSKSCMVEGKRSYDPKLYHTPLYRSWYNMKTRCTNENSGEYKRYGARGITYDPKWETFKGFLTDMQDSYKEGLSIDRIDNNLGYNKDNCRWSTAKEQANNTRKTENALKFTYKGETKRISEWAAEYGIKRSTLDMRLRKMPIELALNKN